MTTLALSMIVKNAAATLRPCLQSVTGIVDQIVVVDTGSTDATCEIAREFGATILSVPWQDHFADARNASIAGATTDWVLVLDADEELGSEARQALPALLTDEGVGGYLIPIWEYVPFVTGSAWSATIVPNDSGEARAQGAPSYLVNTLCRLFRRRADIYFTGRVHEMVRPQIEAAGLAVRESSLRIHHYGHLALNEATLRKRAFYNDLLQKKLADDPNDITTLTMCGLDEWEFHRRPLEALRYFRQALQIDPNAFETWLFTARVLCATHQYHEALSALDVVEHVQKDACMQYTLRGQALFGLGRLAEARSAYNCALEENPKDPVLKARLDYIEVDLGDRDAALVRLRLRAQQLPEVLEVHELLLNALIRTGQIAEAADEAERFLIFEQREVFLVRAARLRAQLRQWERAEHLARAAVAASPESAEAGELLMMSLVAQSRLVEAAAEAERLTSLVSEPRTYLRAAAIHMQLGDQRRAGDILQRGVVLWPQSAQLQSALNESAYVLLDAPMSTIAAGALHR